MRCLSVLDLVILFYLFIFLPWPRELKICPRMGRQFFKNVDFSVTYPLKGV